MKVVIAMAVVWVFLHTVVDHNAQKTAISRRLGKSFWVVVGGQGRSGHQKHRYFFLGLKKNNVIAGEIPRTEGSRVDT